MKLCTNGISDSSRSTRVATCHDSLRRLVQDDAAVGDHEDARLVGHDDDGDAEVAAERDDELVELDRGDRVESGGRLVEEQESSARASWRVPARFFMPPEISR